MTSQISLNSIILNVNTPGPQASGNISTNGSQLSNNSPAHFNVGRTRLSVSPLNDLDAASPSDRRIRNMQQAEVNIPSVSPVCPSPDEIVIKGRGRRSLPIKWSPIPIESPQKLPPSSSNIKRSPKKGIIALRSSPRKRLQLSDPSAGEFLLASGRKALLNSSPLCRKQNGNYSPNCKGSITSESEISKLSQKELVNILSNVINNHPEIKEEIEPFLPKPILKLAEERLNVIKLAINEALPNSGTDSTSFCKVMPHLSSMKQLISEQCQHLESVENWPALLDFSFLAWKYVKETPLWDSVIHRNYVRNPCFKILAHHFLESLQHMNIKDIDSLEVEALYKRLDLLAVDHKDIKLCINYIQKFRDASLP